jgi:predicted nucleotidyltransferase
MKREPDLNGILSKARLFSRKQFKDKLKSVILFGSYARGDYDDESDVDILILVDTDVRALADFRSIFARFGTELSLENGVLVSFVLQDKSMFDYWKDAIPFYKNILEEGVTAIE